MNDWNAVITVREGGFTPACTFLEQYGPVKGTDFLNTLVMRVPDPFLLLTELQEQRDGTPAIAGWLSRFVPMQRRFSYQTAEDFERRCREIAFGWLPRLANARFHVRMHRRGFKGKLSSVEEERFLDDFLLKALADEGIPGKVAFDNPNAIIALETVGPQAGLSLFNRDELKRFSILHLD